MRGAGRCAALLVAALALFGSPARADAETVILWHSFRGREAEALETVVAAFNEQGGTQIRMVVKDGARYVDEVEAAFRSQGGTVPPGEAPDLVVWAHDKVGPWADAGWLLPLDSAISRERMAELMPTCVAPLRHGGHLYGVPLAFESLLFYYNRNLVPRPPRTTDELIFMARSLTDSAAGRYGLVYERGNFYHHALWLHGFGGAVFDRRGDFAVRSPEFQKSLAFARDLATVHGVIPDTVDWQTQMELFNDGKAAFLISGPWAYGSIAWDRVPVGLAPLPLVSATGGYPTPFLGVKAFCVNARTRNPAACAAVLDHLTSAFSGCLMNVAAGYLPANTASYSFPALANFSMTEKPHVLIDSTVLMPSDARMNAVWKVMMRDDATGQPGCIDRVFLEGMSPAAATREAYARYRALVRSR